MKPLLTLILLAMLSTAMAQTKPVYVKTATLKMDDLKSIINLFQQSKLNDAEKLVFKLEMDSFLKGVYVKIDSVRVDTVKCEIKPVKL